MMTIKGTLITFLKPIQWDKQDDAEGHTTIGRWIRIGSVGRLVILLGV